MVYIRFEESSKDAVLRVSIAVTGTLLVVKLHRVLAKNWILWLENRGHAQRELPGPA